MKFKIHYTVRGTEDYFIIKGDDMAEVIAKAKAEMQKRGLSETKNNCWSEKI